MVRASALITVAWVPDCAPCGPGWDSAISHGTQGGVSRRGEVIFETGLSNQVEAIFRAGSSDVVTAILRHAGPQGSSSAQGPPIGWDLFGEQQRRRPGSLGFEDSPPTPIETTKTRKKEGDLLYTGVLMGHCTMSRIWLMITGHIRLVG